MPRLLIGAFLGLFLSIFPNIFLGLFRGLFLCHIEFEKASKSSLCTLPTNYLVCSFLAGLFIRLYQIVVFDMIMTLMAW